MFCTYRFLLKVLDGRINFDERCSTERCLHVVTKQNTLYALKCNIIYDEIYKEVSKIRLSVLQRTQIFFQLENKHFDYTERST